MAASLTTSSFLEQNKGSESRMSIKIVADSACDIPADIARELDITVVPVYINVGERGFLDGAELSREEFYQNLTTYDPYPTTAAPSPAAFTRTYRQLAQAGASHIISLHIAEALSLTCNAARLGAEEVQNDTPITLIDTQQISAGAGLLAIMAAEAAAAGHSAAEIVAAATAAVQHTRVFGMLDTLDSLRRSGRVSWAKFGFGTLLRIKPILMISRGQIEEIARVRTSRRALQHMLDAVQSFQPFSRLAVIHAHAEEAAAELVEQVRPLFPQIPLPVMEIGPAIGAHLGIGAVGFACISANE